MVFSNIVSIDGQNTLALAVADTGGDCKNVVPVECQRHAFIGMISTPTVPYTKRVVRSYISIVTKTLVYSVSFSYTESFKVLYYGRV